jgi:hypothetical protein
MQQALPDGAPGDEAVYDAAPSDATNVDETALEPEAGVGEGALADRPLPPVAFTVMTFNVGTTAQALHDKDEAEGAGDGYTSEHAAWISEHYGNNLAWRPAEEALRQFIAKHRPDVIAFQEMFYDPWCADQPDPPDHLDLVCEGYDPSGPLTAERLVGPDYDVVSAKGHPDNWVAVRRAFGAIEGHPGQGPWLDGAEGFGIPDCCSGARVSSVDVLLPDGRRLTVVDVHTNAGMKDKDMACRVLQFEQVFVDRGDGIPAAHGIANVVMGDMNTDFFLFAGADPSADRWNDFVGPGKAFHYVSSDSLDGPATHATGMHLDHVASDSLVGSCFVAGESEGTDPVMESTFFDHRPVFCNVVL